MRSFIRPFLPKYPVPAVFTVTMTGFLFPRAANGLKQSDLSTYKPHTQLHQTKGRQIVGKAYNEIDQKMVQAVLKEKIDAARFSEDHPLSITDFGSAEGTMMETLLALNTFLLIHACEPHEPSLEEYRNKIKNTKNARVGVMTTKRMEDPTFPPSPSDVMLLMNSLFYSVSSWNSQRNPNLIFENHFFTKLISRLNKGGVIIIGAQSGDKAKSGVSTTTAINEEWENILYPMLYGMQGISLSNHDRPTFANSEHIEREFKENFTKILQEKTGIRLKLESRSAVAMVPLGDINFKPNSQSNRYDDQSEYVKAILDFYTRGKWTELSISDQKKCLNFFKTKCDVGNGQYKIAHNHRIIVVTVDRSLQTQEIPEPSGCAPRR